MYKVRKIIASKELNLYGAVLADGRVVEMCYESKSYRSPKDQVEFMECNQDGWFFTSEQEFSEYEISDLEVLWECDK